MKTIITTFLILSYAMAALADSAEKEITALIAAVQNEKGMFFIRNGSEHTAAEAADHLRRKRKAAGEKIKTSEDFITYCGTGSSVTGSRYKVKFADGREEFADQFLKAQLQRIRHP
ncbi:MAG: hypothetical protein JWO08_2383 [Verrucomicrobiaceae bacterium]|nr:hypothetical protein [Verrucomicrobiaceae bacterium]